MATSIAKRSAGRKSQALIKMKEPKLVTARIGAASATSLTRAVYESLREEVLSGRILPGEKIPIADTASRYDVSLSSVREALSRLVADGLVHAHDQKGFRASPVSLADLRDVVRVRGEIEALALADSIEHGDTEWEARILGAHHTLSKTPAHEKGNPWGVRDEWMEQHKIFHRALLSACSSPWLLKISEMLFDQTERYRRLLGYIGSADRNVDQEHRELLEAFLAHDSAKARILMKRHFETTATSLCSMAEVELSTAEH